MRTPIIYTAIPLLAVLNAYFSIGNALTPHSSNFDFPIAVLAKQLTPSSFSLAATRFIVMLPFLPLLFAVPGATAVALPIFMAVQDRLRTIIPNLPTRYPSGQGSVSSQGILGGIIPNLPTRFPSGQGSVSSQGIIGGVNPTKFRGRRRAFPGPVSKVQDKVKEVIGNLHKTDDVFEQLISPEPDCRRQAVCRLHYALSADVGNFLGNALTVFKLESQVEKLDLSENTRSSIKDMLKAASSGLYRRNCASMYSKCTIIVPPSRT